MFNAPFGIPPANGRIVFGDTESIDVSYEHRDVWEIGLIIRDPGKADVEIEWQLRANLTHAASIGLRIGRYYRRNRAQALLPGQGIIVTAPGFPELGPDEDGRKFVTDPEQDRKATGQSRLRERMVFASAIADQLAPLLDDAVLIGQGPWFDDLALHNFLRDNGQALTSSHRLMCANNATLAYLHGKADTLAACGHVDAATKLREEIPPPPWDPEKLSHLVGVTPPPAETRHRALVDARWVRDRWDAITGYQPPTNPAPVPELDGNARLVGAKAAR